MKLVITVVNTDDAGLVRSSLMQKGYGTTSLWSEGGFLQKENRTLMTGVADDKVKEVISIIRNTVHMRQEPSQGKNPLNSMLVEEDAPVVVSGATIFVVDVDQFLRV